VKVASLVVVLAACGQPTPPTPPPTPRVAAGAPADARVADAAPRRIVGKLGAHPPAGAKAWATTVCVEGRSLVFENFCGCNDALLCHLSVPRPGAIDVTLTLDATRMPECLDCFAMVPARCAFGALAPGVWSVAINGVPALALTVDAAGQVADGACWSDNG